MIKVPDLIGVTLFIDDGDGCIVDDALKSVNNGEICCANLIESPPIQLSLRVDGEGCSSRAGFYINNEWTILSGEFAYFMRFYVCDAFVEVSKAKLTVIVRSHAVNRTEDAQHETVAISTTNFSYLFAT
jgi:hypothetical protein